MPVSRTTTLNGHWHVVSPHWDGFAARPDETDGGKVLGIADLVPDGAQERKGTWRIVVEFTPDDA
jgi:hypothetical protein